MVFGTIILFLIYGNLNFQICRLGYLQRRHNHAAKPIEDLRLKTMSSAKTLTVLVPAYREEEDVVLRTLISAALLEFPNKEIVLLVDDPPNPRRVSDQADLQRMRQLPDRVLSLLDFPKHFFSHELGAFLNRKNDTNPMAEAEKLGKLFNLAAEHLERIGSVASGLEHAEGNSREPNWRGTNVTTPLAQLREVAKRWPNLAGAPDLAQAIDAAPTPDATADPMHLQDHGIRFFWNSVIAAPAANLREGAERWTNLASGSPMSWNEIAPNIECAYRQLAAYFSVRVTSFERKLYDNLSHAPNKAMNLNAYLDLMGQNMREAETASGRRELVPATAVDASHRFDDADYIITLDADSILLGDYALRLVDVLEAPGNARMAIAQTPYSAFPDAPGTLERIAGITTDIQHIIHQGFTRFNSTYWVGANALIRKAALNDIVVTEFEDGKYVRKYVQDRTVIEDTESSVDLLEKDWSLYNYPERLAYSATPADFGSLLIQRRRWANGGLIILPKLLAYIFQRPFRLARLGQGLIQIHYLVSLAASCLGVLILLLVPFEQSMRTWWLPLTAVPYFAFYGADMRALGYKWSDLLRVYALNLALIPVHIGGVLASVRQAVTGEKTPFKRTPKVATRTAAPAIYIMSIFGLTVYCIGNAYFDVVAGRSAHAIFAFVNGLFFAYAAHVFVGLRPGTEDILASFAERRRSTKPVVQSTAPIVATGSATGPAVPVFSQALARLPGPDDEDMSRQEAVPRNGSDGRVAYNAN